MDPKGLDRFGRFLQRRELDALARTLLEGEQVLAAVAATFDKPGVLAATNRRLLFVRRTWLGARSHAWPYGKVHRKTSRDAATLTLAARGGPVVFRDVPKDQAAAFERAVQARPPGPGELVDFTLPPHELARRKRLERLDRMYERGTLTRKEYEVAKANLAAEDEP